LQRTPGEAAAAAAPIATAAGAREGARSHALRAGIMCRRCPLPRPHEVKHALTADRGNGLCVRKLVVEHQRWRGCLTQCCVDQRAEIHLHWHITHSPCSVAAHVCPQYTHVIQRCTYSSIACLMCHWHASSWYGAATVLGTCHLACAANIAVVDGVVVVCYSAGLTACPHGNCLHAYTVDW
jgi:hypothetical protein